MEKNRKIGYLVLGGLLLATFAAHAARSGLGEAFEKPTAHGSLLPAYQPRPWEAMKDPIATTLQPPLPAGSPGALSLKAELDRGALMQNGDGEVHVAVTIDTHGLGAGKRVPTDFVVVFDHSGSMGGQKIEYGKQALRELVSRLNDDDRFSLVAYDSSADVRVPLVQTAKEARASWLRAVDQLSVAGGTNMSSGLDLGLAQLDSSRGKGRATRMLLLSDGLANEGDTTLGGLSGRARRASQSESVLTTIGVGADFDENVMTSLARAGTGAFYYLAKLETLPQLLSAELKTASETYAQRAELRVELAPGVKLVSASGSSFSQQGNTAVVPIGSLYTDYTQQTWLTLKVPSGQLGEHDLASLNLRYRHDEKPFEVNTALGKVALVNDEEVFKRRIVQPVWERAVLEEELARSKEQLGAAIRDGNDKDVDVAVASADRQLALAQSIGNERVQNEIAQLRASAAPAKAAQQAGGMARSSAAKSSIASGFSSRSNGAYKNLRGDATY